MFLRHAQLIHDFLKTVFARINTFPDSKFDDKYFQSHF